MSTEPVVLRTKEVAALCGTYTQAIFRLYDEGRFMAPVDPTRSRREWRWNRARVIEFTELGADAYFAKYGRPTPTDEGVCA